MHTSDTFFKQYKIFNVIMIAITVTAVFTPLFFDIPGQFKSIMPFHLTSPPCFIKQQTGQLCRGCGLSRSIIALYHGKWALSNLYHPLGIYLVLMLLFELIFRTLCLFFRSIFILIMDIIHFFAIIVFLYISFHTY